MKRIEETSLGIFFGFLIVTITASTLYPIVAPVLRIFIDIIISTYMGLFGFKFGFKLVFLEAFLVSFNMIQMDFFVSSFIPSILTLNPFLMFLVSLLVFTILDIVSCLASYIVLSKIGFIRRIKSIVGIN